MRRVQSPLLVVDQLYSTSGAAKYLKVTRQRVEELRRQGRIQYARFGRVYLYTKDALESIKQDLAD